MFGKGKITFGAIKLSLGNIKSDNHNESGPIEKIDEQQSVKSDSGFGKFGLKITPEEPEAQAEQIPDKDKDESETNYLEQSIGFSSFGKNSAKKFDLSSLVEESKKIARERTIPNLDSEAQLIKTSSDSESDDDEMIGPPLPPELLQKDAEEEEEEEVEEDRLALPISHELHLSHGQKPVSGLAVDPSGSRLVSGSVDYEVRYWDFQGMDLSKEAFRSFTPADGYPVLSVDYSCTGDKVLVVTGSSQAKVYDRDGVEVFECARGDMYLHDMAKTKGHIAGLTDGAWHPKNREEFLTSGRDGTCRIWHTSRPLQQSHVLKPRAVNGLKAQPASCCYSRDGLLVACVCDDGSVMMWDHRRAFVNTTITVRNAHARDDAASCVSFSYDNKAFATRGETSLKLWDARRTKTPVRAWDDDLFSRFAFTNCLFSPSDRLVVTGTSLERGQGGGGRVKFYSRDTLDLVKEVEVGASHVVKVAWHPRLNQIMVGGGDGQVRVLYDPQRSRNGALFVAGKRRQRRAPQAEVVVSQQIITPHALPLFREERHKSSRKVEEKDRKDPLRSRQPELPLGKTGSGGRVSTGGSTLSSYIIRNMGIRNKVREEGDPREALLKYAKDASDSPYWVTPAYAKTQPKTIFQQPEPDDEEQPPKKLKTT